DHKAEESGITVDGDSTRKAVAFGGAALLIAMGTMLGRATVSRSEAPRRVAEEDLDRPWGYDRPVFDRHREHRI
ncbi:MAG: hypothetical protein AAF264_08920, partial [Pseudomonadota bacterium]